MWVLACSDSSRFQDATSQTIESVHDVADERAGAMPESCTGDTELVELAKSATCSSCDNVVTCAQVSRCCISLANKTMNSMTSPARRCTATANDPSPVQYMRSFMVQGVPRTLTSAFTVNLPR